MKHYSAQFNSKATNKGAFPYYSVAYTSTVFSAGEHTSFTNSNYTDLL